jgi:phospholipase/carboxylesterase
MPLAEKRMRSKLAVLLLLLAATPARGQDAQGIELRLRAWLEAKDDAAKKAAADALASVPVPADSKLRAKLLRDALPVKERPPFARVLDPIPLRGTSTECFFSTPKPGSPKPPGLVISFHGFGGDHHGGLRVFTIPDDEWEDDKKELEAQIRAKGKDPSKVKLPDKPKPLVDWEDGVVAAPRWLSQPPKQEELQLETVEEAALLAVEKGVREYGVDPDHVILAGISRGGWGSLATAVRHPDRFAGVVACCCGVDKDDMFENLGTAKLPVYYIRAEKDERIKEEDAAEVKEAFERAKVPFTWQRVANLTHRWPRGEDATKIRPWMKERVREPWPRTIDQRFPPAKGRRRVFWVEIAGGGPIHVTATAKDNEISIETDSAGEVVLHLGEPLVDLDKPVVVKLKGEVVHDGKLERTWANVLADLEDDGFDLPRAAPARLAVKKK